MAYLQKMILASNWSSNGLAAAKQFGRDNVTGPATVQGSSVTVCKLGHNQGAGSSGSGQFDSANYEACWLFCCNNGDPGNGQWGGFTYACFFGNFGWGAWDGSKEWNYNCSQSWSFPSVIVNLSTNAYNNPATAIQYICMAKS